MAEADDRLRCLILGQQIGDNVVDLGELLNDYTPQPRTTVARDTYTLVKTYVERISTEMIRASDCGLTTDLSLWKRWSEFLDVWAASPSSQSRVREAFGSFHDALDRNQEEPAEF